MLSPPRRPSRPALRVAVAGVVLLLGAPLVGPVPAQGPPGDRRAGGGEGQLSVAFERSQLTVHAVGVSRAVLLRAIARATGVEIAIEGALDDPATVSFAALPLDQGVRRALGPADVVLVYGPGGSLDRVMVRGRTPAAAPPATPGPPAGGPPGTAPPTAASLLDDLTRALRSRSRDVREAAIVAIARTGRAELAPLLAPALQDPEPLIRTVALDAIADLGGPHALGLLAPTLRDPDAGVRAHAARAVGTVGGAEAVQLLHAVRGDEDARVRQAVQQALEELRAAPRRPPSQPSSTVRERR